MQSPLIILKLTNAYINKYVRDVDCVWHKREKQLSTYFEVKIYAQIWEVMYQYDKRDVQGSFSHTIERLFSAFFLNGHKPQQGKAVQCLCDNNDLEPVTFYAPTITPIKNGVAKLLWRSTEICKIEGGVYKITACVINIEAVAVAAEVNERKGRQKRSHRQQLRSNWCVRKLTRRVTRRGMCDVVRSKKSCWLIKIFSDKIERQFIYSFNKLPKNYLIS